jgi:hypothetical protein
MVSPPPQRLQIGNPANTQHLATDVDVHICNGLLASGALRVEESDGGAMEFGEGAKPER